MAKLLLDVPLVPQSKTLTCWHASAYMLWQYWQDKTGRQGPMNTIASKWSKNKPAKPSDFIILAQKVGLKAVPRSDTYTSEIIEGLLKDHGPLWTAGYWYGYGHIMVLTGIDGSVVHFNDPEHGGSKKTHTLAFFNTKLANTIDGCLMCKDPEAY